MRVKILSILFISLFVISCDKDAEQGPNFSDPNPNDTEFRIDNKSNYRLKSIYINSSGSANDYGDLTRNTKTSYQSFSFAYRIFEIRFKVGEKTLFLTPTDYSGEKRLDAGRYTVDIANVDTSNNTFTFRVNSDN